MRTARPAWAAWLRDRGVVAVDEVDTRALVRRIRANGVLRCAVGTAPVDELHARALAEPPIDGRPLRRHMGTREPYTVGSGPRVALVDLGCKRSIPARLAATGLEVLVVPSSWDAEAILDEQPQAVLVGNGPGDPAVLEGPIETVRDLLGEVPLFGICLGHQLLGLALGLRHLQASVRAPRREPSGARPAHGPRARHRPEPRLRGARRRRGARQPRVAQRRQRRRARRRRLRERPVPPRGGARGRSTPCPSSTGSPPRAEAHGPSLDPDRRLRADPHRPGRASSTTPERRRAACCGARVPRRARQLEPGDDHDRPRVGRRDLPRAARRRDGGRDHRARAARCPAADARRADGAQPGGRALRGGPARRRRADRRRSRGDPARRRPCRVP